MTDNQLTVKRKPKNPIKFKVQLNEEQKIAKQIVLDNTLTMLAGSAGSGKTFLACQIALDGLFSRRYEKIKVAKCLAEDQIKIVPLSFMRGNTFLNSMVIVDEAQNVTHNQMEMIVTRIGLNSKMIVCGDKKQVDLKRKSDSGFNFLYKAADSINGLASVTLTTNHRSPIVEELIDFYTNSHKQGLIKL
jgi:phosphate starvation-inducible protein PhoH